MSKVKAFSVGGVEMWFCSGDHEPPHFHARRPGEWEAKVFIEEHVTSMIQVVKPGDAHISRSDRRALVSGVEKHRFDLLQEWEVCQER